MSDTLSTLRRILVPDGKALIPARTSPRVSTLGVGDDARASKRYGGRMLDTYLSAFGGDQAIDWVMDCVRLIMETTSSASFHFERGGERLEAKPSAFTDPEAQFADESVVNLLEAPNPWCDYVELIELLVIDLLLAGNGYWLKWQQDAAGRPLALYRISPALIEPIPGDRELIAGYEYRPPGGGEPVRFGPDEIIHFRLPNPHSAYKGLSIIAGAPRVYDIELALTETQARFFERGTKLSGVLQTDRRLGDPLFQKIKRQFRSLYAGKDKAYEVAVLEAGLSFQPIQPTAAEAQFEQLTKLSMQRVCQMFRVPPPLLGNMDQANYKMQEAQRVFDTKTMRPFLDKLQRRISAALTRPGWNLDFAIDYEYVMPEEDQLKLAAEFAGLPVTVKEVREKLKLPPLGDDRDKIVLNLAQPGQPSRGRPSEAGRPPNPENVPAAGPPEPAAGGDQGKADAGDPGTRSVDAIARALKGDLAKHVADLEAEIVVIIEGKAAADKGLVARLKAAATWSTLGRRLKMVLETRAIDALEDATAVELTRGASATLDQATLRNIAADLAGRDEAKAIVRNLREGLGQLVSDELAAGHSRTEIVQAVRANLAGWRLDHAETIALSEAQVYYNEGTLRVGEVNGARTVDVLDGEDHDEPCREANGAVWTTDRARRNRTQHPRCRRRFAPRYEGVTDGEATETA